MQIAQNVSTGSAAVASTPEQLRETLKKATVPDLIVMCKAAGISISGCSSQRKEELIDRLVRKKPRPLASHEQVHSAGALGVAGLLGAALCGLCLAEACPVCERACAYACACVRACFPVRFVCA